MNSIKQEPTARQLFGDPRDTAVVTQTGTYFVIFKAEVSKFPEEVEANVGATIYVNGSSDQVALSYVYVNGSRPENICIPVIFNLSEGSRITVVNEMSRASYFSAVLIVIRLS